MPRGFGRFIWFWMMGFPFRFYPPFYFSPWVYHPWFYNPWVYNPYLTPQDYLAYLKEEEKILTQQLEALKKEIAEIEKEIKK
ncbi:MAG TPA: hypothetical protein ENF61_00915 [Firmicutes bacterium]|nr:hypothetical protein [Bacillota bacterium]